MSDRPMTAAEPPISVTATIVADAIGVDEIRDGDRHLPRLRVLWVAADGTGRIVDVILDGQPQAGQTVAELDAWRAMDTGRTLRN